MKYKVPAPMLLAVLFAASIILSPHTRIAEALVDKEILLLELGKPVKQELSGGQSHNYKISLIAGQYVRVVVEQNGIDVIVKLSSPDNRKLIEIDSPNGTQGPESVSWIADSSGNYLFEVRCLEENAPAGSYEVRVEELRASMVRDKDRVTSGIAFVEGMRLQGQGTAEAYRRAIDKFKVALSLTKSTGDLFLMSYSLFYLAQIHEFIGEGKKALEYYSQALQMARGKGDLQFEAGVLKHLGAINSLFGEKQKALKYFSEALSISRLAGDKLNESLVLNSLGKLYYELGEMQMALDHYTQALPIARAIGDRETEGALLNQFGTVYDFLGEEEKALEYYNQALQLARAIGYRSLENGVLINLGVVYDSLGEKQKALENYDQALKIIRATGERGSEAIILADIGREYRDLGEPSKALGYYKQSLRLSKEVGDRRTEANALNSMGSVYRDLGDIRRAMQLYDKSLRISQYIRDRELIIYVLNNIGRVYEIRLAKLRALKYYSQALQIAKNIRNRQAEANTLIRLGSLYHSLGQNVEAVNHLDQALAISNEINYMVGRALAHSNLMSTWQARRDPRLAFINGKQAINTYQQLRRNIKGLDKETQRSYLRSIEDTYRKLADILISEDRLLEAEQVIDLLKEEEFFRLVRGQSGGEALIPYSKAEGSAIAALNKLAALGWEKRNLRRSDDRRWREIYDEIKIANNELEVSLKALISSERGTSKKIEEILNEQTLINGLGPGAVVLYTVISTREEQNQIINKVGWIILVAPEFRKAYPIDVNDIAKTVLAFRAALRSNKYDPQPMAKDLYRRLFLQTSVKVKTTLAEDLETYLGKQGEKTLMWSLDGLLRYVPMAALHDGKQYLAEQYRNVVFNRASISVLNVPVSATGDVIGYGVTDERMEGNEKFPALKGAEQELRAIIRDPKMNPEDGFLSGTIKLNDQFTKESLESDLDFGAPVIHIASHFKYNADDHNSSFLLLGKDRLTIKEVQGMPGFGKVQLLTLSACDTAIGKGNSDEVIGKANGKEVESLAYEVHRQGAETVIASLWPVSDKGTDELMVRFYKIRADNPQITKSEAFNRAQLSLLNGQEIAGLKNRGDKSDPLLAQNRGPQVDDDNTFKLPLYKPDSRKLFAHPHYWAAFIMIGSWK